MRLSASSYCAKRESQRDMAGDVEFVLLSMWLLQARQVSGWRLDLRARSTLARLLTDALDMDVKSCGTTRDGIGISTLCFRSVELLGIDLM